MTGCHVEAVRHKTLEAYSLRSGKVEAIEVHHLGPRGHEVSHECLRRVGASIDFRKAHIPGSRWSTRIRIREDARNARDAIVLATANPDVARLAAIDLFDAGITDVKLLDGGMAAWTRAGYPTESSSDRPPDAECIDYLFFVHDRHAGNRGAMQQYLAWETGLLAQLDEEERASFRIPASSPGA